MGVKRVRILGHRPVVVVLALLGVLSALSSAVSGLLAIVAWLAGMAFDWFWALLASVAIARYLQRS